MRVSLSRGNRMYMVNVRKKVLETLKMKWGVAEDEPGDVTGVSMAGSWRSVLQTSDSGFGDLTAL